MNNLSKELITKLISEKDFKQICEFAKIMNPDKTDICFTEYAGTEMRVYSDNGSVHVMYPNDVTPVQESALARALMTGDIFDDADEVSRAADYVHMTTAPNTAIIRSSHNELPGEMKHIAKAVIGVMKDNGRCNPEEGDICNGINFEKDLLTAGDTGNDSVDIIKHHLSMKPDDRMSTDLSKDSIEIEKGLNNIKSFDPDSAVEKGEDYDELELDADCEDAENNSDDDEKDEEFEEGFFTKKPKKLRDLKARDTVAYIVVEMNNVKDSNDQAMLSGYVCSKLEICDFYINCLDTNNTHYIVPHDRTYLERFQTDLNKLLMQILRLKPINKNDRVWKLNIPDGWRV